MSGEFQFNVMRVGRSRVLGAIEGLRDEQLLEIPAPFKNNILWNLGHILYVQYALSFNPAGVPLPLPAGFKALFMRDTSPSSWTETPSIEEVKAHLASSIDAIEETYRSGRLAGYKPFELPIPMTLSKPEDAFAMCAFHEGVHLGIIMSIKKFVV